MYVDYLSVVCVLMFWNKVRVDAALFMYGDNSIPEYVYHTVDPRLSGLWLSGLQIHVTPSPSRACASAIT